MDDTPVGPIRPIRRDEIAGIDDLVDFTDGRRAADERRTRRWKVVRRSVLAAITIVAGYYAVSLIQVFATGRGDQVEQARPADAIVVLGAAQYDGRPSPQLAARLDHVVTLYEDGVAPLSWSQGASSRRTASPRRSRRRSTSSSVGSRPTRSPWRAMGAPPYESMEGIADLLEQRGLERVVVVTDPYPRVAGPPDRRGRRTARPTCRPRRPRSSAAASRSAVTSPKPAPSPSAGSSASTTSDPSTRSGRPGPFRSGRLRVGFRSVGRPDRAAGDTLAAGTLTVAPWGVV